MATAEVALDLPEVAERMRCSLATVYRRINDGSLPKIDIGTGRPTRRGKSTKLRVLESALNAYLTGSKF